MDEKPGQIAKIEELLANAIRIDPTNARAYIVRGMVYNVTRRTKEAAEAAQNAVRLNPSYAPAYAQLALDQVTPAEYPLAIANIDQAIKLSPRDPEMGRWHWIKGRTFNYMGRYEDAIREEQAALDSGYSLGPSTDILAWCIRRLWAGKSGGRNRVWAGSRLNPKLTIDEWQRWYAGSVDCRAKRISKALRKAGLPEE